MKSVMFEDGVAICGDSTSQDVLDEVKRIFRGEALRAVVTDPPYGNILDEEWDRIDKGQREFVDWMVS